MTRNDLAVGAFGAECGGDGQLASVDEFREHAAECLRLAQRAANDEDRARLVAMAQAWRELGEKLEADVPRGSG